MAVLHPVLKQTVLGAPPFSIVAKRPDALTIHIKGVSCLVAPGGNFHLDQDTIG